jgi:Lsr2
MARRTSVTLQDDLDGTPAEETLRFGISGAEYEIDLSSKNAARLRAQMAPFIEHARKAGKMPRRAVRTAASRRRSREIRAWAQAKGIQLSERGRIPANVAAQYEASTRKTSRRLPGNAPRQSPALALRGAHQGRPGTKFSWPGQKYTSVAAFRLRPKLAFASAA